MTEHFANEAQTTLTAELAKGATTLTVASAAGFPTEGNFRILIDSELLMVTAVEGTTFTVERGIEETTDFAHADGSTVTQVLTAGGLATKADLDEGALRESEIPGSVLLAGQAPAVYASRYGVSASKTGEENSEALAAAIAAAEEQSISRILLPSGTIALKSGFLLNKADDESGTFQYIVQGDGRGTVLELDKELDWLFRVNCTKADEAASETGNLIGRLVLRDLMVKGVEGGTTGLVRIIKASVHMHNVRCSDLDYGVYQVTGYCDHHVFEQVRWRSETNENGWLFHMNGNGDGHLFSACSFTGSQAAFIRSCDGLVIDSCIGGNFTLRLCTGVAVNGHHWEAFLQPGEERSAPAFTIKDSRVRFGPGFFLTGVTQPAIEINDDETQDASQIEFAGTSFGWPNGHPAYEPPRTSHVHIANANGRARFIFEYPRGFCVNYGFTALDPIGLLVTSGVEGLQEAIDAAPELLNGHSILEKERNEWALKPVSKTRTAERVGYPPSIDAVSKQLEVGGKIPEGTSYFYRIAVWDGFQWSERSKENSGKAEANDTAFVLAINALSAIAQVRVWRGSAEGEYDRYIDLPVPTAVTRLIDVGDYIAGLSWVVPEKAEEVPATPEKNAQRDLVEQNGRVVGEGEAAPANGTWEKGTRFFQSNPSAGAYAGWICTEAGTPGTWKGFGKLAE